MEKHAKRDCCSYSMLLSADSRLQCMWSRAREAAAHTCTLAHQCVPRAQHPLTTRWNAVELNLKQNFSTLNQPNNIPKPKKGLIISLDYGCMSQQVKCLASRTDYYKK